VEAGLKLLVEGVSATDRYPDLKQTQIKKKNPVATLPKLKGTGQQCKGLTKVMQVVFEKFWNLADQRHARISVCLQLMKEVGTLYMTHRTEHRVPTEAARRIVEASFEIAQITTGLVRYHHARAQWLFTIRRKATIVYMQHWLRSIATQCMQTAHPGRIS